MEDARDLCVPTLQGIPAGMRKPDVERFADVLRHFRAGRRHPRQDLVDQLPFGLARDRPGPDGEEVDGVHFGRELDLGVGRVVELGPRDLRRGATLLPAVGAVVGALVAFVAWGSAQVLPPFVAAVLGIAAGVLGAWATFVLVSRRGSAAPARA